MSALNCLSVAGFLSAAHLLVVCVKGVEEHPGEWARKPNLLL